MAEPTTAITDFLLAAVALVLAARLIGFWRWAFVFTGIAALSGGVYHSQHTVLVWKITTYSVGLATFFLIAAAGRSRVLTWIAAGQFAVYAIWMATHDDFVYVIADYGTGLIVTAICYMIRFSGASKFILASIAVSVIGAGVQMSGFTLHPRFNHNDLYHVIQMVALYLLYRGARASDMSRSTAAAST